MSVPTGMVELSKTVAAIYEVVQATREDVRNIIDRQEKDGERLRALELNQAEMRALAAEGVALGNRLDTLEGKQGEMGVRLDSVNRRVTLWGALSAVLAVVFGSVSGFVKSLWS